jgi:hypothetical protein
MIVAAVVIIVILAVLAVAFPTITASLQNLGGIDGKGTVTPGVTPVSTQTIDYRGEGAPINLVTFTAGPTQAMSKETALVIETNKDSTNAMVTVQFAGGGGLGLVQDNRVVLTRSDGTVTEGKLNFNQKGSDVSLQGTRGTDRLQVIVTMYSGATYTIVDKLMPYRVRG